MNKKNKNNLQSTFHFENDVNLDLERTLLKIFLSQYFANVNCYLKPKTEFHQTHTHTRIGYVVNHENENEKKN